MLPRRRKPTISAGKRKRVKPRARVRVTLPAPRVVSRTSENVAKETEVQVALRVLKEAHGQHPHDEIAETTAIPATAVPALSVAADDRICSRGTIEKPQVTQLIVPSASASASAAAATVHSEPHAARAVTAIRSAAAAPVVAPARGPASASASQPEALAVPQLPRASVPTVVVKRKKKNGAPVPLGSLKMRDFTRRRSQGKRMPSTVKRAKQRKLERKQKAEASLCGDEASEKAELPAADKIAEEGDGVSDAGSAESAEDASGDVYGEENAVPLAPQVQVDDNGNIVINTESLVYTPAVVAPSIADFETRDEDNTRVTSASFKKRTPTQRWNDSETRQFYAALRRCGTDFTMIVTLFPGRTRKQIRNKFKKEERQHPQLILNALNPLLALPYEPVPKVSEEKSGGCESSGTASTPSSTASTHRKSVPSKKKRKERSVSTSDVGASREIIGSGTDRGERTATDGAAGAGGSNSSSRSGSSALSAPSKKKRKKPRVSKSAASEGSTRGVGGSGAGRGERTAADGAARAEDSNSSGGSSKSSVRLAAADVSRKSVSSSKRQGQKNTSNKGTKKKRIRKAKKKSVSFADLYSEAIPRPSPLASAPPPRDSKYPGMAYAADGGGVHLDSVIL